MEKLALMGLGTALGATCGALGVLAGQRLGFLPPPETPGDPWRTDQERMAVDADSHTAAGPTFDPAVAEEPIGGVSTAAPDEGAAEPPPAGDAAGAAQDEPLRYLTVGEVAELLGATTADLTKDPDLPEPDATVGRTRGWLESTVTQWSTTGARLRG